MIFPKIDILSRNYMTDAVENKWYFTARLDAMTLPSFLHMRILLGIEIHARYKKAKGLSFQHLHVRRSFLVPLSITNTKLSGN